MFPTAGDTLTGNLAVIIAIWFLTMIKLDGQQLSACCALLNYLGLVFTVVSFKIGLFLGLGQKAGTM